GSVEMFGSCRGCLHPLHNARVCKEDVDFAFFGCDLPVEPIKIFQVGYISPDRCNVLSDLLDGTIQFGLAASRNKNKRPFRNEVLGGSASNSAATPVITATLLCNVCIVCIPSVSVGGSTRRTWE